MRTLNIVTIIFIATLGYNAAMTETNTVFYVSKNGNNQDGSSWATAWNELNQIDWASILPGSIIYIDGGETEMRYETELQIGASGDENAPIQMRASSEAGHQGQIIFFGGRSAELPYCGQSNYEDLPVEAMREYAIRTNDHDNIIIDGGRWRGIVINGYSGSGLYLDANSYNITVQYLEIFNNGEATQDEEGWRSNHPGVVLAGERIVLRRMLIHDNGQDSIQSMSGQNNIHDFHLEQSWLYNERRHPSSGQSANYCTHTDGIQIFDGGVVSGINVIESVIGPGFTQNLLLGQTLNENGSWADVQDVVLQDSVFSKAADNNVVSYRDSNPSNWRLTRVTIDCLRTESHCLRIENSNHIVEDSIVINGLITFPDGLDNYHGNCLWQARGFELGEEIDLRFVSVSPDNVFSLDDYALSDVYPCSGSRITSAAQLLAMN